MVEDRKISLEVTEAEARLLTCLTENGARALEQEHVDDTGMSGEEATTYRFTAMQMISALRDLKAKILNAINAPAPAEEPKPEETP